MLWSTTARLAAGIVLCTIIEVACGAVSPSGEEALHQRVVKAADALLDSTFNNCIIRMNCEWRFVPWGAAQARVSTGNLTLARVGDTIFIDRGSFVRSDGETGDFTKAAQIFKNGAKPGVITSNFTTSSSSKALSPAFYDDKRDDDDLLGSVNLPFLANKSFGPANFGLRTLVRSSPHEVASNGDAITFIHRSEFGLATVELKRFDGTDLITSVNIIQSPEDTWAYFNPIKIKDLDFPAIKDRGGLISSRSSFAIDWVGDSGGSRVSSFRWINERIAMSKEISTLDYRFAVAEYHVCHAESDVVALRTKVPDGTNVVTPANSKYHGMDLMLHDNEVVQRVDKAAIEAMPESPRPAGWFKLRFVLGAALLTMMIFCAVVFLRRRKFPRREH